MSESGKFIFLIPNEAVRKGFAAQILTPAEITIIRIKIRQCGIFLASLVHKTHFGKRKYHLGGFYLRMI